MHPVWTPEKAYGSGTEARYRLQKADDWETVVVLTEVRWMDKTFWELKVTEFERTSEGWHNRHDDNFEYPWNDTED